jgi:hypothetical protein
MTNPAEDPRQQESRHILERVARESDVLGASALVRAAREAGPVLVDRDEPEPDRVELWAKRIGRSLGVVFAIYLLANLVFYFAGR